MALLEILTIPDKKLKTTATKVLEFDAELASLATDMLDTMYQAPGIGLAATQVDVHKRMLVLDVSEDKSAPMVMINPEIIESTGIQTHEEGCLSVPGIYANVKRADHIKADYQDLKGKNHQTEATGLLAVCIQHEIDHLNGIVFLDHLSVLKRKLALKKLSK